MGLEDELTAAVVAQRHLLLTAAQRCLEAERKTLAPPSLTDLSLIQWAIEDLRDAEALTAVLLNRAGLTWEALAMHHDVSRQALHRRLSPKGEELAGRASGDVRQRRRALGQARKRLGLDGDGADIAMGIAKHLVRLRRRPYWWHLY